MHDISEKSIAKESFELCGLVSSFEVRKKGHRDLFGTGRVVYIGIAADAKTALVPVDVRLLNPDERLRCEEPVQVRFPNGSGVIGAR